MKNNRRKGKEAIAYRRVSTDGQGESGVGFEGQLAAIEEYASLSKYRIVESFHDVGSGRGRRNLIDRSGLQKAIEVAKATGWPIIVSGLDRISRETKTTEEIVREHRVEIISAGDGKMLDPVILASAAARAQREGERISQTTKEGMEKAKAEGVRLGNPTNLPDVQRLGVERVKEIADETVHKIVNVLDEFAGQTIADPQLVDILNERGILTSRKLPWTIAAIRRPRRTAQALIKERDRSRVTNPYEDHPLFGRF